MLGYVGLDHPWGDRVAADSLSLAFHPLVTVVIGSVFIGCESVHGVLELFNSVVSMIEDHPGDDCGQEDNCDRNGEDFHGCWLHKYVTVSLGWLNSADEP